MDGGRISERLRYLGYGQMNANEEDAFQAIVTEMHNMYDKPLPQSKRDVFHRSFFNAMSINEFARIRDKMLRNLQDGQEVPRGFGPANVWAVRSSLRARPPIAEVRENETGDSWDIEGNQRLWIYVRWKAGRRVYYGGPDAKRALELTAPLLAYKAAWVIDCREHEQETGTAPPMETQRSWWIEVIRRAETEITSIRERHAQEDIPCPI